MTMENEFLAKVLGRCTGQSESIRWVNPPHYR